jgi:hypothetical protein
MTQFTLTTDDNAIQTMEGTVTKRYTNGVNLEAAMNAVPRRQLRSDEVAVIEANVDGHQTSIGITDVVDGNRQRTTVLEGDDNVRMIDQQTKFVRDQLNSLLNPDGSPRLIGGKDVYAVERAKLKGQLEMLSANREYHEALAAQRAQEAAYRAEETRALQGIAHRAIAKSEALAAVHRRLIELGVPKDRLPTLEDLETGRA